MPNNLLHGNSPYPPNYGDNQRDIDIRERGKAEGRREILRRVAQLPMFTSVFGCKGGTSTWQTDGTHVSTDDYACAWCGWSKTIQRGETIPKHPDDGCLWSDAMKLSAPTGEEGS